MLARRFIILGLAASIAGLTALACPSLGAEPGPGEILVLDYNVKSLFDDRESGSEYPDFSIAKGRWDGPRYRRRLEKLAEVILAASPKTKGPDIVCLEEIENGSVLEALRKGPLAEARYRSAAIAPAPGQAIASAVLSRYPIVELKTHATASGGPEGRYILELSFEVEGQRLRGFVCHWKSKLEGAAATETARREAACLLARRISSILESEPGAELFVCGDFNENPDEYRRVGRRYLTALYPESEAESLPEGVEALLVADTPEGAGLKQAVGLKEAGALTARLALFSPWASSEGYSYIHKEDRERIDGFLLAPGLLDGKGLSYLSFSVLDSDFLLDAEGKPKAWSASSPEGYSDHLPLMLRLSAGKVRSSAPRKRRPRSPGCAGFPRRARLSSGRRGSSPGRAPRR
jgi:endonuclease/exonuclease/phosphatase family metal-dependent hydrolase